MSRIGWRWGIVGVVVVVAVVAVGIARRPGRGEPAREAAESTTTTLAPTTSTETTVTSAPSRTTMASRLRTTSTTIRKPTPVPVSTTRPLPPTLTVATPEGGFPERGMATIAGSGLPANRRLFVVQCPAEGIDPHGDVCDSAHWLFSPGQADAWTDERGVLRTGSTAKPFRRVMNPDGPTGPYPRQFTVDCATTPCVLGIFAFDGAHQEPLATAALHFAGPAGPPRPMTAIAEPIRDLNDGQMVRVTGDNAFGPQDNFTLSQCGPHDTAPSSQVCTPPTRTRVDEHGHFSGTVTVHATFTSGGYTVDCRLVACWVSPDPDKVNGITFAPADPDTAGPAAAGVGSERAPLRQDSEGSVARVAVPASRSRSGCRRS